MKGAEAVSRSIAVACGIASVVLLLLVSGAAPTQAAAATTGCGKVEGQLVRAVKGDVSRSSCRSVAAEAFERFGEEPSCGQWNTPDPVCRVGEWRCWIPTAGTQTRENLVAYCFVPKPSAAVGEQSYKPATYKKLIKIGGDAQASQSGLCHTATQTIEKLRNLRCSQAVNVASRAAASGNFTHFPECPGDKAVHWQGWKLTASPSGGGDHPIIGTRFSKDEKSFTISGGGAC